MLIEYVQTAMRQAKYKILEDGTFYGSIPDFEGLWANADTLEGCREELQSALEDWMLVGLRLGHTLPVVGDINLTAKLEVA